MESLKMKPFLKENYANKEEMNDALMAVLVYYMLYRRHGGVRKELNVKNPFQAVEKWFEMNLKFLSKIFANLKIKL